MFCKFCGNIIDDDTVFCPKCGGKQNVSDENSLHIVKQENCILMNPNDSLDRSALKLYLGDIRALELSKDYLLRKCNNLHSRINSLGKGNKWSLPRKPGYDDFTEAFYEDHFIFWVMVIAGVALYLLGLFIDWFASTAIGDFFGGQRWIDFSFICFWIMLAHELFLFLSGAINLLKETKKWKQKIIDVEEHNRQDDIRVANEIIEKGRLNQERSQALKEYNQATELLKKAYDLNIIPNQFRNIFAAYYLYDFITTSNEPFSNALLHFDLDTIKQQLTYVINQNQQIILNQQIQIAQNDQIIKSNRENLKKLSNIEKSSERAVQYASIAANNAEACAWIATAQYIKS